MASKKVLAALLISTLAVPACNTSTGFDQNIDRTKTKQGAIIGGLVGAVAGMSQSGDNSVERKQRAVRGALIGAGLGAAIGNELDKQVAELQRDMNNNDVIIQNTGDRLIVTLPQDILFAVDSTHITPSLRSDLSVLAQNLINYPNSTIQIIGHTDNTGSADYNQSLSTDRALAVSSILQQNGVPQFRIQSTGRGESQPIASNLTPEGRAQNRRVDVVILPN
jgi:outer membrane protein OmpA-like peptidoglycan-associated protein